MAQRQIQCSHYTGFLFCRHENHIEYGFCSHLKTVISTRFCNGVKASPFGAITPCYMR